MGVDSSSICLLPFVKLPQSSRVPVSTFFLPLYMHVYSITIPLHSSHLPSFIYIYARPPVSTPLHPPPSPSPDPASGHTPLPPPCSSENNIPCTGLPTSSTPSLFLLKIARTAETGGPVPLPGALPARDAPYVIPAWCSGVEFATGRNELPPSADFLTGVVDRGSGARAEVRCGGRG